MPPTPTTLVGVTLAPELLTALSNRLIYMRQQHKGPLWNSIDMLYSCWHDSRHRYIFSPIPQLIHISVEHRDPLFYLLVYMELIKGWGYSMAKLSFC